MLKQRSTQRGAYLIVASVLLVVLLGFGALALDIGRLFVLRSQMQNGVDAAALAAAAELKRNFGARSRAEAAARNVLEYDSAFSEVSELLGVNITVEFFCAIKSQYDPTDSAIVSLCGAAYNPENKVLATSDVLSQYVRVTMDQSATSDAYSVPLFFLPILNLFGLNVDTQSFLQASAVAGQNYTFCNYSPIMICNPFEGSGGVFDAIMAPGEQVIMAIQGQNGSWVPGNIGFLSVNGSSGAAALATYLADQNLSGCSPPVLTSEPGQMAASTAAAINTRFDVYTNPAPFNQPSAPSNWPPAANVIDYPRDATFRVAAPRFGNGDWDRAGYFATYHDWQSHGAPPGTFSELTRFEVYQWEISENKLPSRAPIFMYPHGTIPGYPNDNRPGQPVETNYDGTPDPSHVYSGTYPPAPSDVERRVLKAAVVNCNAQNISGRATYRLVGREGFANFFITEQAYGPNIRQIWAEYIGWSTPESDDDVLVDIQLYE